ncbi:MAG: DUF721 domain-containing protein [Deltaproteobacteria bacterium]|nr:DUF721 domain-containing protein [Deltaproteobacteria bacterium]
MRRKGQLQGISRDVHEVVRAVSGPGHGVPPEVHPAWQSTVGPAIARVTRPDSLRRGVLTVVTKNSVWVNELMMLQERILAGLEAALGERLVAELRFRVGRVHAHDRRERRVAEPAPPPRELDPAVTKRLEAVHDPVLRDAIARALARCAQPKG